MLHWRLRHAEAKSPVDRGAHGHPIEITTVNSDNGNGAKVSATVDGLTKDMGTIRRLDKSQP